VAKRTRPKKAAATSKEELPAADSQADTPPQDDTTPAKQTKRARAKASPKAEAKAVADAAAPEGEKDAKKLRRMNTPKRDKDSPLPRSLTPRQVVPEGTGKTLKVLSLNVAGLRSVLNGDKAQILKALVERELPDIFCLNEHKLKQEDVEENEAKLKELLPKEYATMHWTCSTAKKGYSGVAMIIRHSLDGETGVISAPTEVEVTPGMGELGEGDTIAAEEGRILTMELPQLVLVSTYVPNSGQDLGRLPYRVDRKSEHCWDRNFAKYVSTLRESKKKPVVVIGDLNCCAEVQDIWNMYDRPDFPEGLAEKPIADQYLGLTSLKKSAGLTPEERESFPKMLKEADLVDTFRALHPDASGVFSYYSMRVVKNRSMNQGLRLDYVLASSSLCAHLRPSAEGGAAKDEAPAGDLPVPRIQDSFILDEDDLVADHTAVGCTIVL